MYPIPKDVNVYFYFRYFYGEQSSQDEWPKWSGVKHGDELEFSFGIPLANPKQYDVDEIGLARDILTYWINFVKNGSVKLLDRSYYAYINVNKKMNAMILFRSNESEIRLSRCDSRTLSDKFCSSKSVSSLFAKQARER